MAERKSSSRGELLRALYFNRTGLLFLFMIIASIGMFVLAAGSTGGASQFWLAVATSLLATTIYSVLQVLLTTEQFEQFLKGSIQSAVDTQLATVSSHMMEDYRAIQRQFIPVAQYTATANPDPAFNRDINKSVQSSSHYIFRGMTGKYAVARLGLLSDGPSDVKLIIADPSKPATVDSRARLLLRTSNVTNMQQAREKVLDGIIIALAGVHLIHGRFDHIEVCLTSDPHIDRVEIFDDEIYLTLFSGKTGRVSTFPLGMKFMRESLIYQMYSRDCSRLLASPYPIRFIIPHDITSPAYTKLLSRHGLDIDQQRLAKKEEEFRAVQRGVRDYLVPP